MHRVLRVETVRLDELGPVDSLLAARPEQPLLLATQVTEVAAADPLGEDRWPKLPQPESQVGLDQGQLVGDEQEQEHGRVTLERQPHVLAQAVCDQVEIARSRAGALWLGALDPVLE